MKYLDLTHTFTDHMPVWPGEEPPEVISRYTLDKDGHNNVDIKTSLHAGTHIDAPYHFVAGGKKISEVSLDNLIGPGVLIDARGRQSLDVDVFDDVDIKAGSIVLVLTGWSKKFGSQEYYQDWPVLTEDFAKKLVELKIAAVGTDAPSPDQPPFPVHKILLPAEVLSLENLANLESLVGVSEFKVYAIPIKFEFDGSPVRVFAEVP